MIASASEPPLSADAGTAAQLPALELDADDALMVRMQAGDSSALGELVARHQQSLIGFFFSNTRDLQLAEDLTQETLLRVYDQAWDFLPTGRFRAWLFRVARNLLIDTVRRQSRDALVQAVRSGGRDPLPLNELADAFTSPESQADQKELAALVDQLLQHLPEEQRLTFVLYHYSGLSLPEIAEILEAPLPTTKSRLRLVREKLREQLEARGITGPTESTS